MVNYCVCIAFLKRLQLYTVRVFLHKVIQILNKWAVFRDFFQKTVKFQ